MFFRVHSTGKGPKMQIVCSYVGSSFAQFYSFYDRGRSEFLPTLFARSFWNLVQLNSKLITKEEPQVEYLEELIIGHENRIL